MCKRHNQCTNLSLHSDIIRQFKGINGTDFDTRTATDTGTLIGLPDKIGGRDNVPRDLPSFYVAYIPAGATAAVSEVLNFTFGIFDEVNQPFFFAQFDDIEGFFL